MFIFNYTGFLFQRTICPNSLHYRSVPYALSLRSSCTFFAAIVKIISQLDKSIKYIKHEVSADTIIIYVKSIRKRVKCSYCGEESVAVHSRNIRKIQDLPIAGKKVLLLLERRKFFCINADCTNRTFAETYEFVGAKSRKTNRLQDEILRVSLTQSSISASKYLRKRVANVGKSTICNMLKKRESGTGVE